MHAEAVGQACPHFGICGGCRLHHLDQQIMLAWKADRLRGALARAGFAVPEIATVPGAPGERRRADFALWRGDGTIRIGFHAAADKAVLDLAACAVLQPALTALIPRLRPVINSLGALRRNGSAICNALSNGLDVLLVTDGPLGPGDRERLIAFAEVADLSRLSWTQDAARPEPIVIRRAPTLLIGAIPVTPPAGAFLQATARGEAAITHAVLDALPVPPRRAPILELYAGIGTLTFPLTSYGRVRAVEGSEPAITALREAANRHCSGRIETVRGDLTRFALGPDLDACAVIVLDPPAAGAPQTPALAASGKPVIYVSCDPASLARDGAHLRAAGYALRAVTLIDQFLWSSRIEAVCVFDPPRRTMPRRRL